MTAGLLLFGGLIVILGAVAGALFLGHHAGIKDGQSRQWLANQHALAEAERLRIDAEIREADRERTYYEHATQAAEKHAEVEAQRNELLALMNTGDIENAIRFADEINVKLTQDLERIHDAEKTDPRFAIPPTPPKGKPS